MDIESIIDSISKLPEASRTKIIENTVPVTYPKGHILIHADTLETSVYFIKKGIVRAYVNHEGNDITFWFGTAGETIISMKSYVENKRGIESIELLEDCELYRLQTTKLQQLYLQDIHIANWGRKFAEQNLKTTEERLISSQFRTAKQRYRELLKNTPHLIQRVQLGHIASYLGITQVSLSRIRAEIK
ncbi:cAMP-binding domain of CRP or a regulatory subunit of cAMP-dependent protein kinases [Zobellia uliginosa]|uniref:cAMP-binding domain of CRP or a regulatory subunit of cAMP-dependent protein kinases n=1 Tax=Zobellia uliginosa TaxID=143224 RepID=A0ABY1KQZ9_9FLAO|nr:Crp/Fnr family transcriptional regulator [Zobellia uliginosa]SIS66865.1 cAMP-binding domain of CRP or a regulatory subunit of cAMP-dependent protein kinases [Zobellia uliginosa]